MQLLFLGTAAAEGYPGLFCPCEHCQEARRLGGKNQRFRSALLVDRRLLIDFGPDLLAASQRFNVDLSGVTTGLITHAHSDHFYIGNFEMREGSFTNNLPIPTLHVFGPVDAIDEINKACPDLDAWRMTVRRIEPFITWKADGYTISTFQAYHAVDQLTCVFYGIEDANGSFLYATDTGPFPEPTWAALKGRSFDVIILEETLGTGSYSMHLGFDGFLEHATRFRKEGLIKPGGRIIAHHLSHSANPPHAQVEAILGQHGIEVAYDGMIVNTP